jgi:hypothetical protein
LLNSAAGVILGPAWLNVYGDAALFASYGIDYETYKNGGGYEFTVAPEFQVWGAVDLGVSVDIGIVETSFNLASLEVDWNSESGNITFGIGYPEPYIAYTKVWGVKIPYPSIREATYTFTAGNLKLTPPKLSLTVQSLS